MNNNTKIARELVKIANDLMAASFHDEVKGMNVEKKYSIKLEPHP